MYQRPQETTTLDEAGRFAQAVRRVTEQSGLPANRCIKLINQLRKCDVADIPPRKPEWRPTMGRRMCRHILRGLEPNHWQGEAFNTFREALELLILTDSAKPDQLWVAVNVFLKQAATGDPLSIMETRMTANGLAESTYSWTLVHLRDEPQSANVTISSAETAIDAWPAHYPSPHPERLKVVLDATDLKLTELQCELICAAAAAEAVPRG